MKRKHQTKPPRKKTAQKKTPLMKRNKSTMVKSPPRKAAGAGKESMMKKEPSAKKPKARVATIDEIDVLTKQMMLDSGYSVEFGHPCVEYSYPINGVDHLCVDFLTPP